MEIYLWIRIATLLMLVVAFGNSPIVLPTSRIRPLPKASRFFSDIKIFFFIFSFILEVEMLAMSILLSWMVESRIVRIHSIVIVSEPRGRTTRVDGSMRWFIFVGDWTKGFIVTISFKVVLVIVLSRINRISEHFQ